MTSRLFVAVRPPERVLDEIEGAVARARRSIVGPRWTAREQWHVTLQFLGAVDDDRVSDVSRALDGASAAAPFAARLGGGGAFPKASRARVVWLGLEAGHAETAALAGCVNAALAPLGFEPERREFTPHVTLARLRSPGDVAPAVEALGDDPVGPAFAVEEVVLFESRRSRAGASYEPLVAVALAG